MEAIEIKDIKEMLKLLNVFRNYYDVILGLNENEARDLENKLMSKKSKDTTNVGKYLVYKRYVDQVVIHPVAEAYLINRDNTYKVSVPKVKNPVLTVGGGDNFNAGFSWGILNNLTYQESLILGTINARLFVEKGSSPSINDLYNYLNKNKESIGVTNL
jgi:fructose-1-phosphate kinase PfkB-like protein